LDFELVRYSQQDPRWKGDRVGGGSNTIGYIGCAVTSVAMYASGWGFVETPGSLNQKLKNVGGFVNQAIVWGAISKLYPPIKFTGLTLCGNSAAPIADIHTSLGSGQPVVVEVDFSPAGGLQTHWVLLYKSLSRDYLILDPWPFPVETDEVTLLSRFAHGNTLQRNGEHTVTLIGGNVHRGGHSRTDSRNLIENCHLDIEVLTLLIGRGQSALGTGRLGDFRDAPAEGRVRKGIDLHG